jgi:erythromycin esterase
MNRLKTLFALLLCILSFFASGQEGIKKYVQDKAVEIATIRPDDTGFADLEVIGEAIGDAKVVMYSSFKANG